ncbi:MAG: magnesium transporter [Hymenobacter sp.]
MRGRRLPAADRADILAALPAREMVGLFRSLPVAVATETFVYADASVQHQLLGGIGEARLVKLLAGLAPDDRTTMLARLPAATVQQLLCLLPEAEKDQAVRLLGYPAKSVGRLMSTHYIAVQAEQTVAEVLDDVRRHRHGADTLDMLYVTDAQGQLVDDIRLGEFLLVDPTVQVRALMDNRFIALKVDQSQEEPVRTFRRHARVALPVVNDAGLLLGIVSYDDILDVAAREQTEDIQKLGGSEALEEPYMQISLLKMVQKRAGWLVVLFLGEMLTATAMGFFEGEIEKAVVLALFVPLIISTGGNAGSQATSLIIRALSLGEVTVGLWWRVMRREVLAGLALGGVLGTVGFIRIAVWQVAHFKDYGPHWGLIGLTVGLSLIGIVLWGSLAGSMLPLILRRLGFDPATSSAPFVATLVDVTGLIIYFSVAYALLHGTLL